MHDAIEEWESNVEALATETTLVCSRCITDTDLWTSVEPAEEPGLCCFCGTQGNCVTFENLEPVIVEVIGEFYVSVEESGAFHDDGEWSEHVEDIQNIVNELLQDAVDSDVQAPLVRYVSSRNAVQYGFVRTRDLWASLYEFHEGDWHRFMEEARAGEPLKAATGLAAALNPTVRRLFAKITEVATLEDRFREAQPLLWRCRPGPLVADYCHAQELGTAPDGMASAGRLNAAGHSCFYGSTTKRGAVIESAKHGGADVELWAGRFTPSRGVFHLDVMEVPDAPSPFAPDAADTHDAIEFLARFAETIRQPNNPEDTQHYLPTQIFTAYLIASLDGPEAIRFASSIDPTSENWVVFVDRDHCVDSQAPDEPELYLVLGPETVEHLIANDFIGDSV